MDTIEQLDTDAENARRRARDHREDAIEALRRAVEGAVDALAGLASGDDDEACNGAMDLAEYAGTARQSLTAMLAERDDAVAADAAAGHAERRADLDSYHARVL